MINILNRFYKLSALAAGALSVLVFAPYFQVWVGVITFSILFYLLSQAKKVRQALAIGYWFGFAHFALGFAWVGNALLIEPERFGWLYPITLIAAGGFFGLFVLLPSYMSFKGQDVWSKWLLFISGWVITEWLRSFILTGFPWNLLGYSLAFNLEIIQSAALGGTYLTSLIAIAVYTLGGVYLAQRDKKMLTVVALLGLIIVGGVFFWGSYRLSKTEIKPMDKVVRIVQPSIPQTMKWSKTEAENNFAQYMDMSFEGSEKNPDLIVWGETASPFMLDRDEGHLKQLSVKLQPNSILLAGMVSYQYNGGAYRPHNSMIMINDKGNILGFYHKSHLVPFGEYIPLRKYLPQFVQPVANAIGEFGHGNGPETFGLENGLKIGAAICYEIIFPHQIVDEKHRPDVLVNLTNDGWYGNSAGPYQHWVATKFRAIEEGISVIRAANNGISGVIDPLGREKGVLGLNAKQISDVILDYPIAKITTYGWLGNKIIIILCLLLMIIGVIKNTFKL